MLDDIQSIKEEFERIITELNRPIKDIKDWLSGGLSTDLQYILNISLEALFLAAKLGVTIRMGTINIKNPVVTQLQNLPAGFVKDPAHAAPNWADLRHGQFRFPTPYVRSPNHVRRQLEATRSSWRLFRMALDT